jgi:murein DD-endopeptidase MepM/ murein hydrolase activator NlpD
MTIISFGSFSVAGQLSLNGKPIQGGLIFGWATPNATILLDGKSILQSESGNFLIGFPHNAETLAQLVVSYPDGSIQKRSFSIEQRSYKIERINYLPKRKVTPNAAALARINAERTTIKKANLTIVEKPFFIDGFIRPILGRISGVFGSRRILNGKLRRPHFGIDIAAPEGSDIKAASSGVVVFVHEGMFFNGKTLVINHGLGLRSTYVHMSKITVKLGTLVTKGEVIGKVGQTGRATGSHLHWAIHLNSMPLDPEQLLR